MFSRLRFYSLPPICNVSMNLLLERQKVIHTIVPTEVQRPLVVDLPVFRPIFRRVEIPALFFRSIFSRLNQVSEFLGPKFPVLFEDFLSSCISALCPQFPICLVCSAAELERTFGFGHQVGVRTISHCLPYIRWNTFVAMQAANGTRVSEISRNVGYAARL